MIEKVTKSHQVDREAAEEQPEDGHAGRDEHDDHAGVGLEDVLLAARAHGLAALPAVAEQQLLLRRESMAPMLDAQRHRAWELLRLLEGVVLTGEHAARV